MTKRNTYFEKEYLINREFDQKKFQEKSNETNHVVYKNFTIDFDFRSTFLFSEEKYWFIDFKNYSFGTNIVNESRTKVIVNNCIFRYINFDTCVFENIEFINCSFIGCKMYRCITQTTQVIFDHCDFCESVADVELDKFKIYTHFSIFEQCGMNIKFINCDLSSVYFHECTRAMFSFDSCLLQNASFDFNYFQLSKFIDCDLSRMYFGQQLNYDVEFDLVKGTNIVDQNTYFEIPNFRRKSVKTILTTLNYKNDPIKCVEFLRNVSIVYERMGLNNEVGYYYYYMRLIKLKKSKISYDTFKSLISLITCGFGEKPQFGVVLSAIVILLYSYFYWVRGLVNSEGQLIYDYISSLHFSVVTFTTVGYGNLNPQKCDYILNSAEMLLGVFLIAIVTSTFVRKMTR